MTALLKTLDSPTLGAPSRSCCSAPGGRGAHVHGERPHRPEAGRLHADRVHAARGGHRGQQAQGRGHDRAAEPQALRARDRQHRRGQGGQRRPRHHARVRSRSCTPARARRRSTPTRSTASSTSARRRRRSSKLTILGGFSNKTDGDGDGGGILVGDFGDAPLTILRSRIIDNRAPWVGRQRRRHRLRQLRPRQDRRQRGVQQRLRRQRRRHRGVARRADADPAHHDHRQQGRAGRRDDGLRTARADLRQHDRLQRGGGGPEVEGDGGGIYVGTKGRVELTNSTIADNGAYTSGGGIFSDAGSQANDQLLHDRAQPRRRRRQVRRHHRRHPPAHRRACSVAANARISNSIIALNIEAGGVGGGLRRDRLPRDRRST